MNKEKRVYGLFNDSFPPVLDGVTLTVQNYVEYLVDKGNEVCVVTPWNPYDPPHPHYEMHRYFSLPIYNRHPYRYGYPLVDPFIWAQMRRLPFKIVHAHCPFSSGRLARYAARKHGVPLVATFHSKYKTDLDRSLPPFMVDYQMKRIRDFYNGADAVWIPQAAVEETVREYGITAPVTVVDNGNDFGHAENDLTEAKREARHHMAIPSNRLVLLFVGQHILEKGVEIILESASRLKASIDWELHFVGTGYAAGQMKQMAQRMGIDSRVTFHGVMNDRDAIRDVYAAADLFVFPSMYDNAPLVVREAAMMGTPSILPVGSTAAEPVTDGVNGFLSRCTAEAYTAKIEHLAANRQLIDEAARGARTTLARTWNNVMDEVIIRYDDIINRYDHSHRHK